MVKHHHRLPKSSLKGSSSRLTLEAVAQAARRNAALKNTRLTAQTSLRDLLHGINSGHKVHKDKQSALAAATLPASPHHDSHLNLIDTGQGHSMRAAGQHRV